MSTNVQILYTGQQTLTLRYGEKRGKPDAAGNVNITTPARELRFDGLPKGQSPVYRDIPADEWAAVKTDPVAGRIVKNEIEAGRIREARV